MRELPVFIVAFVLYIVVTGSMTLYDIITGVITGVTAALLFSKHLIKNPKKALNPCRWLSFLIYFIKYVTVIELRAHLDVMKRIITKETRPGIVKVPITVRDEYGRFLVANSITNTPGTVTVYMDDEYAYVNWISVETDDMEERRRKILEEFEKNAIKIFGGADE
ncbi:MAG TPA: cation:proton antiporter [Pyrodictiaceae archaeon]|uniref:Cation:proton antiporter n=1 Tax=Thermococcus paralvinellae TaxID=582419 RepID=A0A832ZGJ4_9EURY|nr:cation:proton antiporter [Pyrodictiaceae archaeon]HIP89463.1 cation:proton antiporter [Thermococcus paralvinellae]